MSKEGKILPTSYRIPPELREALARRAANNHRSANQELIVMLERYLARELEQGSKSQK